MFESRLELKFESFMFPAGEVGIKLDVNNLRYKYFETKQIIVARIQKSSDILELALIKDALSRFDDTNPIHLFMPYCPYGRQDRACVAGESFSLKTFAALINAMNFASVTIIDPHSDVVEGVFNNVKIIRQFDVINNYLEFGKRVLNGDIGTIFCSPDAGANKKTAELAKYFNHAEFIRADKLRELSTGKIKETIVYADDLKGAEVVIADDICDGGRTFTELAKVLKAKGAAKVILYVTHGIFSKGVEELFKGGIDEIFTTDSWGGVTQLNLGEHVTTLELEKLFIK